MESDTLNKIVQSLPDGIKKRILGTIFTEMRILDNELKDAHNFTKEDWERVHINTLKLNAMLDTAMQLK